MAMISLSTICWNCGRACGGCSWSTKGVPVKGWSAVEDVKTGSYNVIKCPRFIPDCENHLKRLDTDGAEALVAAIVKQVVLDYVKGSPETAISCERFVNSRFFKSLTNLDSHHLMKLMKEKKDEARKKPL